MKILVLSQMYPCRRHPTSAVFFANLMQELAPRVAHLTVIAPRPYVPRVLTKFRRRLRRWFLDEVSDSDHGVEIFRPFIFLLPWMAFAGLNGVLMYRGLRKFCLALAQRRQYDLILAYNLLPEGIAAVRLARDLNLPVGVWAIGSDVHTIAPHSALNMMLVRKSLLRSDVVLTESRDLERTVKSLCHARVPVQTFYKGIQVSKFQDLPPKFELTRKLGLAVQRRRFLFVGRLMRSKGVFELAVAFIQLAERYPDFDLLLIGEMIERPALVRRFAAAGVLDRVQFCGTVAYDKIAQYMKASDLLLFPSWAEGLPNVVLEAMAVRLPVIATHVGGTTEVLENDYTGLVVPPRNAGALAAAAIRMLEDKNLRESCVHNAWALVCGHFDVKKNVNTLLDHLGNLMSKGKVSKDAARI